ncbi:MAG: hypothetical protein DMF88_21815 [Acidobacteria bacterium]|nr:MAG: hypothetical protein DMF88_21815 [Acidobacteriota bacterium]
MIIGFIVTVAFVMGALLNGAYAARTGSVNVFAVKIVIVLWTTAVGMMIVIQITVMTKRILRAIELASKK